MMTFTALLLLAFVSEPTAAGGNSGAAAVAQAQPKQEKKICKRFDASESRLGSKRICKTAAEWLVTQDGDGFDGNVRGNTRRN